MTDNQSKSKTETNSKDKALEEILKRLTENQEQQKLPQNPILYITPVIADLIPKYPDSNVFEY